MKLSSHHKEQARSYPDQSGGGRKAPVVPSPSDAGSLSPVQLPGCLPVGFSLDSLLTLEQFAIWRAVEPSTIRAKLAITKGVVRFSQRDVHIHPRTFLELTLKIK